MTNPTPPGQVPEALLHASYLESIFVSETMSSSRACRIAAELRRLHADNKALRAQQDDAYDHGPQAETVEEAARDVGKWLNERPNRPLDLRHVAMLTHHAKRTAHVQNPAEIEHVAGDVSKNGAEVNTSTQQTAPAGATQDDGIAARRAKYLRNDTDAGRAYVAQYLRSMGQHYFDDYIQTDLAGDFACALAASLSTPQPAPATQQAGEVPSKAYAWVYVNKYGVDSIPASKDWCAAMASGHGGSMFPLYTAPQPSPTAQAASSAVLKAIREANMQLDAARKQGGA